MIEPFPQAHEPGRSTRNCVLVLAMLAAGLFAWHAVQRKGELSDFDQSLTVTSKKTASDVVECFLDLTESDRERRLASLHAHRVPARGATLVSADKSIRIIVDGGIETKVRAKLRSPENRYVAGLLASCT